MPHASSNGVSPARRNNRSRKQSEWRLITSEQLFLNMKVLGGELSRKPCTLSFILPQAASPVEGQRATVKSKTDQKL